MRPAGLLPNIAKLVPPWGRPKIARNADPFMKGNPNQVEAANLSHQPIANRVFRHFRREGAKHPIPDDEDAGIIAVKIARVGRVMDAVVAGRVHHCFKPARKTIHHFGMNPELVDEVYPTDKRHHRRMKAEKQQGHPEDEANCEKASPCLPQRGRQIIMLAGMVVHMARPEPADAVGGAVKGIIGQIIDEKAEDPRPPGEGNGHQPEVISPKRNGDHPACHKQTGDRAAQPESKRGQRIFRFIFFRRAALRPDHLDDDEQDEPRHSIVDRVRKIWDCHAGTCLSPAAQYWAASPRLSVIDPKVFSPVPMVRKF